MHKIDIKPGRPAGLVIPYSPPSQRSVHLPLKSFWGAMFGTNTCNDQCVEGKKSKSSDAVRDWDVPHNLVVEKPQQHIQTSEGIEEVPKPATSAASSRNGVSSNAKRTGETSELKPLELSQSDHQSPYFNAVPSFRNGMFKTNRGNELTAEGNQDLNDEIDEEEMNALIKSSTVVEKFKTLDDILAGWDALSMAEESQSKIQKVPFILRDTNNFKKHYEPRVVSIGPYHHGNLNLKLRENLKLKIACLFIKENGLRKDVVFYKIKREIKDLRKCYEEEKIECFNDDDLAWMFFVDGCSLLQYLHCAANENCSKFRELGIKVDCLKFVQHDLFLLENQLPYQVLNILISCLSNKSEMRKSIHKFIFESINAPGEKYEQLEYQLYQKKDPTHLLDLLRTTILQSFGEDHQMSCSAVQQLRQNLVEFMSEPLEKIRDLIECIAEAFENSPAEQTHDLHFFRNVEELKAAGIRLRPSNTSSLAGITFSHGILKLPRIIVDDSTASKFLNLIAYEMCPDFFNDFGVSSYIAFLDALIDRAEDVKELRDKQIMRNVLGSDEEVAKLFNEIGTNLVPNPNKYFNVKRDVQKRYNNKWMTWIAQFNHIHFRSPWSVLAFLAAIIALASTVIQAVFTVLQHR